MGENIETTGQKIKIHLAAKHFMINKHSVLTQKILQGCFMLLIPMSLLAIYVSYSTMLLDRSFQKNNTLSFHTIENNLNAKLNDMSSISNLIIADSSFNNLITLSNSSSDKQELLTGYGDCMNKLADYSHSFQDIDIMCYIPESKYIITPRTVNTIASLSNTVSSSSDTTISADAWDAILTQRHERVSSSKYLSYQNFGQDSIVFSVRKADPRNNNVIFSLYFSIPSKALFDSSSLPDNSSFLLTQKDGVILSSLYGNLDVSTTRAIEKKERQHVNGVSYLSVLDDSSTNKYCYALLTPYDSYFRMITAIKYIAIVGIFIIIFAGTACIIYIEKKSYLPIQKMVNSIHAKYNDIDQENEFALIDEFINRLNDENQQIQNQNHRMQEYAKNISLHNLLTDDTFGLSCRELIGQLTAAHSHMTLVSISPEIIDTTFENQIDLLLWSINNAAFELYNAPFKLLYYKNNCSICYMIYYNDTDPCNQALIIENAQKLYNFFLDNFHVNLSITYSEEFTDPLEARNIHHSMQDIMAYRIMTHSYGVAAQETTVSDQYHFIQTASDYREKFHNVLFRNSSTELTRLCDQLFTMYQNSNEEFNACKYHLLNIICPMLISPGKYKNKLYENAEQFIVSLCRCTNFEQLYKDMLNIMNSILSNQEYLIDEKNQLIINEVKTYINDHYMDAQLSVSTLAELVNLSSKYLGTLYRKITTEGIPQYINRVRINKSIDLIASHPLSCEELAQRVGFSNSRSFQRNFKQFTGFTPNEYKQKIG